uniref:Opy2 domain-containing protein n=1 Tax=Ascaris lumbricoides TaxID=6252 RepID=A0A0M3HMS2_ASCLU
MGCRLFALLTPVPLTSVIPLRTSVGMCVTRYSEAVNGKVSITTITTAAAILAFNTNVIVNAANTGNGGFLGTGLSFGADIGIVIGCIVALILIVSLISFLVYRYCCSKKSKPKSEDENIDSGEEFHQLPLSSNDVHLLGKLPEVPPAEDIPPSPQTMPTQAQLQQQLVTTPPAPPIEPIESQPYYGALESSLEPYLAQAAVAAELAEKGNKLKLMKRKKENEDAISQKVLSAYDRLPVPAIPNPYGVHDDIQTFNGNLTPAPLTETFPERGLSQPPYQVHYSTEANLGLIHGSRPIITGTPRTAQNYSSGYPSYLPHLAISPTSAAVSRPLESASLNPTNTPPVYSISQGFNVQQNEPRSSANDVYPLSTTSPYGVSHSNKQLSRISNYDYMLH